MRIGIDARELHDDVVTNIGLALSLFLHYVAENEPSHDICLFSGKPLPVTFKDRMQNIKAPQNQILFWDQITLH